MIQAFAFYLFAALLLASAATTILARNPVHSVLWLIVAFFNAAGLMVLVGAEFIAMLLVIVYVGAVAVLFLFVVMMLDVDFAELRHGFLNYLPVGGLIGAIVLFELLAVVGFWAFAPGAGTAIATPIPPLDATTNTAALGASNIEAIGALLYGRYLFLFEASGIILLVAMIGAIVLTHRERKDARYQNVTHQNSRRPQDATRNVKPEVGQGVKL